MDEVVSARIRLEGERAAAVPTALFAVVERARARSLVDLLHARPLSQVRQPEELRAGERKIASLQMQLLRTTHRANRQRLLEEIFRSEEALAPMTTELFSRSRRSARAPVTLRAVQSALRPNELLFEVALGEPASFAIVVSRSAARLQRLPGRASFAPLDDLVPVHGNEFVKHNHLALCAEDTPELNTCVFEKSQAQESILGSIARERAEWDSAHRVGGPD